jgi:predicted porin
MAVNPMRRPTGNSCEVISDCLVHPCGPARTAPVPDAPDQIVSRERARREARARAMRAQATPARQAEKIRADSPEILDCPAGERTTRIAFADVRSTLFPKRRQAFSRLNGMRPGSHSEPQSTTSPTMQKTLIALAILAAAGAASAQSSVTVYGKVDLGLVYDAGAAAGKSVRVSSGVTGGSRLGFKGVEDLGGGNKFAFQLETGYCADSAAGAPNFCTGSNSFMGRQAHGDLTGAFGALSAGRQYSLGYLNLTTIDPFGTGYAGQVNNIVDAAGVRLNNSVHYTTPVYAGLTASAELALGETTGNWKSGRVVGASVNYASGPAYAGASYYQLANANGVDSARKDYLLGGSYDFGVVKAHALVEKADGDPTGAVKLDTLDLMAGVTVPLGHGSLLASYVYHDDRGVLNRDANQWGTAYNYPLSKRTSLYVAFARIANRNGAAFHVGNATESGTGNKAFNLGAVHNF